MPNAKTAWNLLIESIGDYSGHGVNHERQEFDGLLSLQFDYPDRSLSLISTATGNGGVVYHSEKSFIGFDVFGALVLFVASNNHPGITPHPFHRVEEGSSGEQKVVFRFGDLQDRNSFREEINFNIFPDQSIEHFYSWGMPGGDFEPRSGSRMYKRSI